MTTNPLTPEELDELERLADVAPEQNIEAAEISDEGEMHSCPLCSGEGQVNGDTFTNYTPHAVGVQFFGVGDEHVWAQAYFNAVTPSVIKRLIAMARGEVK